MDIFRLIRIGGGERVEFKESLSDVKGIMETICAFLNSRGGYIIVGVDDSGHVKGIDIGRGTIPRLVGMIRDAIEPQVIPQIEVTEIHGRKIIVIKVDEGIDKPYLYKGIAFKRVGASNQRISREELERIILEKYKPRLSAEDNPVDATLSDISESIINRFVHVAENTRHVRLAYSSKEDFLRRMRLIRDSTLTLASILLFSEDPQPYVPYAVVKCGRFKDPLYPLLEREITGNLFDQVELTLSFIRENISYRSYINENGVRVEKYEIPLGAIREAIVNAVVHRDYSIPSPIYVKIFDDRIEVINPGKLPDPLTPEDLKREHQSILRNPKIGNVMFLYGYIEKWGTGTNKMIKLCIEEGLREPDFIEQGNFFKVILYRKELSEIHGKIMELLKSRRMTSSEVAKHLGVSERTARKYLKELFDRKLVRRVRIGKSIYYFT